MKKFAMLLSTVIAIILVGYVAVSVSAKAEGKECLVENNIYETAKKVANSIDYMYSSTRNDYYVKKNDDGNIIGLYESSEGLGLWECYIPSDFESGENPFDKLKYLESENEIPMSAYLDFGIATKLVSDYVVSSNIINDEDKAKCLDVLENGVSLYLITIDDSEPQKEGAIMITNGTNVYLNDNFSESYFNVHSFTHELIHVVSNITNFETKNEDYFYNACNISEAITEIITLEVLKNADIDIYVVGRVPYEEYIDDAYALIGKCDILYAYFYSDYYDVIFEEINKDAFDLFFLSATNMEASMRTMGNQYVIWQQIGY